MKENIVVDTAGKHPPALNGGPQQQHIVAGADAGGGERVSAESAAGLGRCSARRTSALPGAESSTPAGPARPVPPAR